MFKWGNYSPADQDYIRGVLGQGPRQDAKDGSPSGLWNLAVSPKNGQFRKKNQADATLTDAGANQVLESLKGIWGGTAGNSQNIRDIPSLARNFIGYNAPGFDFKDNVTYKDYEHKTEKKSPDMFARDVLGKGNTFKTVYTKDANGNKIGIGPAIHNYSFGKDSKEFTSIHIS